jgi:glycosyl transferase family 1
MLMRQLGYQPAADAELAGIRAKAAAGQRGPGPSGLIPAAVLAIDPLISYSGIITHAPLGLASVAGERLSSLPAWFLISPTWTIESEESATGIREAAILHRIGNPSHRLIFICNTPEEVAMLQQKGEAAFFYNKTANVRESVFRPLAAVTTEFDAIYNAQLISWKRHELSLDIESCAFLFYRDMQASEAASDEAQILAAHKAAAPGHHFINSLDSKGVPVRLSPSEVNAHLNRAAVGLCLSAREGAMFASMEYLLSGLPIVSTPSLGGRHVYHDEEYCLTVPTDARAVAQAVDALKSRSIPRDYIHERTVARLERDRSRFLGLLNTILEESGSAKRLAMPWPFSKTVTMQWHTLAEALRRAEHGVIDGYQAPRQRLLPRLWRRIQRLAYRPPAS